MADVNKVEAEKSRRNLGKQMGVPEIDEKHFLLLLS